MNNAQIILEHIIQAFIIVGNSMVLFLCALGVHNLTYLNVFLQSNVDVHGHSLRVSIFNMN